jgi:hypothetical protein
MRKEISCSCSVSNLQLKVERPELLSQVKDNLSRHIAASIVDAYMLERTNEFSSDFSMNVIVANPEDYWRDVELKAFEIRSRFL